MPIVELLRSPGLAENTDEAFRRALVEMGARLDLDPGLIGAVMSFETGGSFDPAQTNLAGSGATGLVQFMPSTARLLGTTTEELAQMSAVEQLDYVEMIYEPWAGRLYQPIDYYLVVFSPAFVGDPPATPMYSAPSKAYEQNSGLDVDGDGVITVGDVTRRFGGLVATAETKPPIVVDLDAPTSGGGGGRGGGGVLVVVALVLAAAAAARKAAT